MDFFQTDEQKMMQESVKRLLERHYDFETRQKMLQSGRPWSPEVWEALAEMGILGLPFAEEVGGFGGSMADVVAVAEPFGAHLLIEPYVSSILLAGQCLAQSDSPAAQAQLAKIVTGEQTAAFAHEEGKGTADPALVSLAAAEAEDGFTLSGEKRMVLGATQADTLVVSARTRGTAPDADGLSLLWSIRNSKGSASGLSSPLMAATLRISLLMGFKFLPTAGSPTMPIRCCKQ